MVWTAGEDLNVTCGVKKDSHIAIFQEQEMKTKEKEERRK